MKLQRNDPRVARLRSLCREKGAEAIVLSLAHNTAWLLGGRVQIGISTSGGICDVVITAERVCLLTSNIEAQRMRLEEVCSDAVQIIAYSWHDGNARTRLLAELCPAGYLSDADCEESLYPLRTVLLPAQQDELRTNCSVAARIMEECCFAVLPGMTELEIAGLAAQKIYAAGIEPIVLIAACDERIRAYRHPISTANKLCKYMMLSMGVRRNGQYASITRFVSFGAPDAGTLHAQTVCNRVAAMLYTQTRPGVACKEIFRKIGEEYARYDCGDQLELHHQGGVSGFQVRECRVTQDSSQAVMEGQTFAWNPSVTGFKSEDMLLVGKEENTLLTATPNLPSETVTCEGRDFQLPIIVVR